jgi:hypothetical protein
MIRHRMWVSVVVALATGLAAGGQFPAPPAVPTAPAVPGVPSAGVPAAPATPGVPGTPAAPGNIWSKIMLTPDQKAACKKHWCESGVAQFLGMMIKPMTLASGGLIKPCCPGPDQAKPEDLLKPSDSVDGAAAQIKADEAQAKARRANVRYLGTVDCSRYPEAEKALINALRTDRNECVRWEAAIVLGHGCCCTRKTIEALKMAASGSDKDNNPKESSERVRAAAEVSLYACQTSADAPPAPPEKAPPPPASEATDASTEQVRIRPRIRPMPLPQGEIQTVGLVANSAPIASVSIAPPPTAPTLIALTQIAPAPIAPAALAVPVAPAAEMPARVPTGQRGLIDLLRRNLGGNEPPRQY